MWKKKQPKTEEKVEEVKKVSLLEQLCGEDTELREFLSHYLFENPLMAVSTKNLDVLISEGEASGKFGPALDKALFEGSQNLLEKEKYIGILNSLGLKIIQAIEQEITSAQRQNLTDRVSTLEKRKGYHHYLVDNAGKVLDIAAHFYGEKLVNLEEGDRRELRDQERKKLENDEWKIAMEERAKQDSLRQAMKHMGKEERRQAELALEKEEQAAEARKQARLEGRQETAREEQRIGETESAAREARKTEREGK